MHTGPARRGSVWRVWMVVLALAFAGATFAAATCHEEHAANHDCVACHLRHQPDAELPGSLQTSFSDVSAPLKHAVDGGWISSGQSRSLSVRAPPA